jgi:hypothetical protein
MSKHDRHVSGKLVQLANEETKNDKGEIEKKIIAQIVLDAGDWGVNWLMDNAPYGKGKIGHWYFHNPTEETRLVMANLGVDMTEKEMTPAFKEISLEKLKKIEPARMPFAPEPAPGAPLTQEAVSAVVEQALERHSKAQKNGAEQPQEAKKAVTSHKGR